MYYHGIYFIHITYVVYEVEIGRQRSPFGGIKIIFYEILLVKNDGKKMFIKKKHKKMYLKYW